MCQKHRHQRFFQVVYLWLHQALLCCHPHHDQHCHLQMCQERAHCKLIRQVLFLQSPHQVL